MTKKVLFAWTLIIIACHLSAQDFSRYEKKIFVYKTDTMPYRLLLPENYNPSTKYPVIFFLHGSGERGNNNEAQLIHGGDFFLVDSLRKNYPAFVVFPQCSANGTWANAKDGKDASGNYQRIFLAGGEPTKDMQMVQRLVKTILQHYPVNKKQVYIGGLSLGGMGTFEIVARNPKLFAAAFPICGGANVAIAPKLKHVRWWVFHGAKDNAVLPEYSKNMVAAMKELYIPVQFTLYPEAKHNSWDNVFQEPGLFAWMFSNVKK